MPLCKVEMIFFAQQQYNIDEVCILTKNVIFILKVKLVDQKRLDSAINDRKIF